MKILTYNVPDHTNNSYWYVNRSLINQLTDFQFFYGSYGYTGGRRTEKNLTVIPNPCPAEATHPPFLRDDIKSIQPDIIFEHEDPQRCLWFKDVEKIPIIYWLPLDNEDPRLLMTKKALQIADKTVTVCKFAQKFLVDRGYPTEQIYLPIESSYKKDDKLRKSYREKMGLKDDDIILTWVGKPAWRKRFIHILEIAKRIIHKNPKVHLLLHTDASERELHWNVMELTYAMDLIEEKNIFFPKDFNSMAGYSFEDMNGVYNATDIYISPAGGEGFGLPLAEAMACGKPIISTDFTSTQEFCGYKERKGEMLGERGMGVTCKYFFEDRGVSRPYVDIAEFVSKTEWLIAHPEVREEMGKNGMRFVEKEMNEFIIGQKWKKIFYDYGYINEAKYVGDNIHQGEEREVLPEDIR